MIDFLHPYYGTWINKCFLLPRIIRNWKLIRASRHSDVIDAAQSMATLNYFAKGSLSQVSTEIYNLKRLLTKYLYLHYPTDVKLLKQELRCNSCDGTGVYQRYAWDGELKWEEECWHCRGTGIYRTVEIIGFVFHVEGIDFAWHQPRPLVDFDVYIPATTAIYEGEKAARYPRVELAANFLIDYLAIWAFLYSKRLVSSRIGLLPALRVDLKNLPRQLWGLLKHKWPDFLDWLIGDNGDCYDPYYINQFDEDFPF